MALSVLVGACGGDADPGPTSEQPTVWQAITDQITGDMSTEVALQAFSYVYHVAIPGVRVPDGVEGGDGPQSGTGVLRWVVEHWSELTVEQRRVVGRYRTRQPGDLVLSEPTASVGHLIASRGGVRPGEPAETRDQLARPLAAPSSAVQNAYAFEIKQDLERIGTRLGLPIVRLNSLDFSDIEMAGVLAVTHACPVERPQDPEPTCLPDAPFGTCNIVLPRNTWSTAPAVTPLLHTILTHEVVHCYQNSLLLDPAAQRRFPKWIAEGSALWLSADDTRVAESMVASQWTKGWFGRPQRDLVDRTYDGFSYFALLDHIGRDLWGSMANAWRAAGASSLDPSSAFVAALDGDGGDVKQEWGPSLLNNGQWGGSWVSHGFGLPTASTVSQAIPIAVTQTGFENSSYGRNAWVHTVTAATDEIVLVESNGTVAVHESKAEGRGYVDLGSTRFCVRGDCVCPKGTRHAGERMADKDISIPLVIAINGGPASWRYRVAALSLEDECQREPDPTASPTPTVSPSGSAAAAGPPCPAGCARSNGDPHLRTVDNAGYDFQAAGEYVLIRSPEAGVEIQARQEPFPGKAAVSVNTAVAIRAGGQRIAAYVTNDGLEVRVDGVPIDVTRPLDLPGAIRLVPYRTGLEVDLPDGSKVYLLSISRASGIGVVLQPSEALQRSAVGLLGATVPGGLGVPALPDGTRLPRATDAHDRYRLLYEVFASAWRVTATDSLFDYDPGASSETYLIAGFPAETAIRTVEDLTDVERDAATRACAGITDGDLLLECLFDVSVTDLMEFADLYRTTDTFLATGPAALDRPPPSGEAIPEGFAVVIPALRSLLGAALGPDGTVYLSVQMTADTYATAAVDPADLSVRALVRAEGGGRVAAAAGSVWIGQSLAAGCVIARLDPTTLATQATVPVPCDFLGPALTASGDSVWFLDRTTADADGKGGRLRRIDPATNLPASSVEVPFVNGFLGSSEAAIFWRDTGKDTYRLRPGEAAVESIGNPGDRQFPVGDGVWTQAQSALGPVALFTTQRGGPDLTMPFEGWIVGADAGAVYAELADSAGGTSVLWRYPIDGGDPQRVARGTTVETPNGDRRLGYVDGETLLLGHGVALKLWLVMKVAADPAGFQLLAQTAPIPPSQE